MGSKEVRKAEAEASARNIDTAITMTGDTEWLTVPTSDLRNVLEELGRLQRIESALLNAIDWKMTQVESARLAGNQAAREWQIEEKINRRNEERELRAEAYMLTRIKEGKEIA